MTSISWNDLNDSSELSDASSDEPPRKPVEEKSKNVVTTTLQKTVSTPAQQFSYSRSDNQKIAQNLQKLQKHQNSRVWLYVPELPDERDLDSQKILKNLPGVQQVKIFSRGANVYIKYQFAANLLQKGHSEKGTDFKFLYSHKNENRDRQNNGNNKKGIQKKYSQKYQEPRQDNYNEPRQIKKKDSEKSDRYRSDNNRDKYEQKTQKKKVKYVAKDSTTSKIQQQPLKSLQSIPQKSSEPSHPSQLTQSVKQSETSESKSQAKDKSTSKVEKQQKNSDHDSNHDDKLKKKPSEFSEDNRVEKKKAKKTKKKNKDREDNFHDPNNPFSFAS